MFLSFFAFRPFAPYLADLDLMFADLELIWEYLGPSWAHLGAILGDPGPIFGPSRASLAPLLRHLGQSWGHVAPFPLYLEGFFGNFLPSPSPVSP